MKIGHIRSYDSVLKCAIPFTSCGPNSAWRWDNPSFSLIVYAVHYIPRGAEITVSYCDLGLPRPERQYVLKGAYAFDCTCSHCTRSDDRRMTILQGGYDTPTYWDWLRGPQPNEGELVPHLLKLLKFVEEEGLRFPLAFDYYFQLAACYGALGKEKEMKEWGFKYLLAILPTQDTLHPSFPGPETWISWLKDPPRFFPEWKAAVKKTRRYV
jgi:hypothetical protein